MIAAFLTVTNATEGDYWRQRGFNCRTDGEDDRQYDHHAHQNLHIARCGEY